MYKLLDRFFFLFYINKWMKRDKLNYKIGSNLDKFVKLMYMYNVVFV